MKAIKRHKLISALVALAGVSTLIVWLANRNHSETTEYVAAPAEMGSLQTVVQATGIVQTLVTVQVGSQISGQIIEIDADFNSTVRRGQLLAKIDPRPLATQVENAEAALNAARARLTSAQAGVRTAAAGLANETASRESARVSRDNAAIQFKRAVDLNARGLISGNDYDLARADADTAKARYEQADATVEQAIAQQSAAAAQVDIAQAQLEQAQADRDLAQVNLEYANIVSPIDGVVISRNVDVGQTVASSIQSPTLFTIANDLKRMRVSANIDEADIGIISDIADVRFTVDAWHNDVFHGQIEEIRLSPTITQNVVTYSVLIHIDNSELKLKPGMTANVTITLDRRDNVLKVPNLALHYQPSGVSAQVPQKMGIPEGEGSVQPAARTIPSSDLAPGQKWNPAEKLRLTASPPLTLRSGRVWVVNTQGTPEPRSLVLGLTDGTFTEVISGPIVAGDQVIVRDSRSEKAATQPGTMNPLLPQTRGGRMR